ncbi:MAG: DUF3782 domain-containing protein [Desulfobacterales bacterium]|nr:DUF3782 domain-containing protein [Desulfobacterales bacterium]
MENIQTTQNVKDIIISQLPIIIQNDYQVRDLIFRLFQEQFASKKETNDRFTMLIEELSADREDQRRQWDEQNKKWDEENKKWYEQNKKLDEQNKKWEEQNKKWDEENKKWDEQNNKWDEQNKKWKENQETILEMIKSFDRKINSNIGALGARWGLYSEQSFRNALKGILEESLNVQVINFLDYDDSGEVFGEPDQVELDIIIKNGILIICEIKSSISKPEMYTFYKKTLFYEKRHNKKADRKMVISPILDEKAYQTAKKLGIEIYTNADDVRK